MVEKHCSNSTHIFLIFIDDGLNLTVSVVSWSEFLATVLEVRVRFPAIPDFLRSYLKEKVAAPV
jgi:hypothetical protein